MREDADLTRTGHGGAEHRDDRGGRLRVGARSEDADVDVGRPGRDGHDLLGLEVGDGRCGGDGRTGERGVDIHRHAGNAVDDEDTGCFGRRCGDDEGQGNGEDANGMEHGSLQG